MKTPVTMRDVAAKAGVTPTVVSRVLHNKATSVRVSDATALRVREAAKELGYRVNVFARNFRERHTNMIGVLHGVNFARPNFSDGSRYFAVLMDGIVEGAFRNGYAVTLCPKLMGQTPEDAMSDGRFDGLIWYSTVPSEANRAMLMGCTSPLVMVHSQADQFVGRFPIVSCDNAGGIGHAIRHLTEIGHRRIAFARQGGLEFSESLLRKDAFVAKMKAVGLSVTERDIIDARLDHTGVDEYYASGLRHTAVIAHNEGLGAEFVRRAPRHGIRIPDDLSVVGFDSTSFCDELRPRLTSISQPLRELGEQAVEALISRMRGDEGTAKRFEIPCGIDIRESTAPPRA
ncbi:LacI family transcriptional regulator [bacterium]|nr:MAG: LacI family transcriptional regulator [bacterium]